LLIIDNAEKVKKVCPTVEYTDSWLWYDFVLWIMGIKSKMKKRVGSKSKKKHSMLYLFSDVV